MSALLKYLCAPGLDIRLSLDGSAMTGCKETSNSKSRLSTFVGCARWLRLRPFQERNTPTCLRPMLSASAQGLRSCGTRSEQGKRGTRSSRSTPNRFFADLARCSAKQDWGVKPNNLKTFLPQVPIPKQKNRMDSRQASLIECCFNMPSIYFRANTQNTGAQFA